MTVDRIACLDKLREIKAKEYWDREAAFHFIVYKFAGLDYDEDEDEICNLMSFLSLNDSTDGWETI